MIQPGTIVKAKAGRDSGRFFAVLSVEDGYAYIADGKTRRIERPKKKKLIHLAATAVQLGAEDRQTDRSLRMSLARLNGEAGKETL